MIRRNFLASLAALAASPVARWWPKGKDCGISPLTDARTLEIQRKWDEACKTYAREMLAYERRTIWIPTQNGTYAFNDMPVPTVPDCRPLVKELLAGLRKSLTPEADA